MSMNKQSADEILYWMGYIQTDGSVRCDISSDGNLKPMIKVTSRSNTNILSEFKTFLAKNGLNGTLDPGVGAQPGNPGRGDSLRLQGKLQVGKFLKLCKEAWQTQGSEFNTPFLSYKRRNFALLEQACFAENLTVAQKLAIKLSFNKANRNDPDCLPDKNTKTREQREQILGLEPGDSSKVSDSILKPIDDFCKKEALVLKKPLAKKFVVNKINPNFWIGCLDGDGGFHASVHPRSYKDSNQGIPNAFEWRGYTTFTQGLTDLEVMELYRIYFSIPENETMENLTERVGRAKKTNAYQIQLNTQPEVRKILSFVKQNGGLRGSYKKKCFEVLEKLETYRENDILYKKYKGDRIEQRKLLKALITEIYTMNTGGSGPVRTYSVDEMHAFVDKFYK